MANMVRYPGPGCVVEYMEGNAPQIALVMEEQGGRLRLLLPNRRETRLGVNRLLPWSGPGLPPGGSRDDAVRQLEERRRVREELTAGIPALEVWEMAQGEMERASAQWFAELFVSDPDVDTVAAYGHALLACKSHFKFHPPDFEIHDAATVEARLAEQEAAREREAILTAGVAFFRLLWEVFSGKRTLPPPASPEWPHEELRRKLEALLRQRLADPESHDDEILWKALSRGLPDLQHLPLHLAEAWGLVPPHHNFWLDRADYSPGNAWAAAHGDAVDALARQAAALTTPTLDLPFCSIDGASTRDVDDAFAVEERPDGVLRLTLALACPALFWPFDSALDKAVARRATSLYLPEATHHMMPDILGTDVFSLTAGQVRPALCVTCDVASDGTPLSCTPSVEHVRLAANLCYEDCEAVLEDAGVDNPAAPYREALLLGERLARARQTARIAAGAVIMDRPDPQFLLEGEGADIRVRLEDAPCTPRAQTLVSESMILASAAMAQWAGERHIPMLYRTQDVAIPREYAGVWTEPHQMARIIRALAPATLETAPRPHAGLGAPAYSPITSPLRRYPDLINEAQIVHWLRHGEPRLDAAALEAALPSLHARLDAAGQVQRYRPRYWKLLYFRQQGDKIWWDAVVTEENDAFVMVSLPRQQLFIRGRRRLFSERACPGQAVRVRVGKVSPLYNEIYLLESMEE